MSTDTLTKKTITTVLLILAIAGIYFLFGLLGLELAIPPSQAGAIWPPAGIALASMLLYGPRIWPGIFIGNFCISAWAFGFDASSLPVFLATGTGGTLFAYIGSLLIKKHANYPGDLIIDRDIILFLLLGGPVSCLIPATIGISAMALSGIISPSEIYLNWLSWWVGDTIGVLIFTPIMLTIFTRNSLLWKRRRLSLGLPLIASFTFMLYFFFHVLNLEAERNQQLFIDNSLIVSHKLKNNIHQHNVFLHSIYSFYNSSKSVEEYEFRKFTHSSLEKSSIVSNIKFFKYEVHENNLILKFNIKNINTPSITAPSFPSKLLKSIQFNKNTYSPSFYLSNDNSILNFYSPIFGHQDNKDILLGIIVISCPATTIINNALNESKIDELQLSILNTDNTVLFNTPHIQPQDAKLEYFLQVADQSWQLKFFLDTQHLHSKAHWSMWWVLISGLLFTSLLGCGLLLLTGRYLRTEQIVSNRTAELLIAKDAAESANQAKTQFLSNISHELRTPLNGILGFSQLINKKTYLSPEDKKHLGIISHCGNHLLSMINEILDISKIESKKITIKNTAFDFNLFIEEIIAIFQLKAKDKGLTFSVESPSIAIPVIGDANRLNQIICNLLANAIKFTSTGGITLKISHDNETLKIIITDTGCGINKTDQKKIFFPFTQIDNNNFSEEGIGLGLAICTELTKLMEGTISVSSIINQGSTFTVSIPFPFAVSITDKAVYATQAIQAPLPDKFHILIADDNEINLIILSFMLENLNCTFDTAMNGAEALNLLCTKNYQLALIDLNMPVMNGFELIKSIRDKRITTPIIAISAYADTNKITEALSIGFNDYLTKPIAEDQLNSIIIKHA